MKWKTWLSFLAIITLTVACSRTSVLPTQTPAPVSTFTQAAPTPIPTLTPPSPTRTPMPKTPLLLEKGPYLLFNGSPTGMRVMWQSTQLVDYTFDWGVDRSYASGSMTIAGDPDTHLYQIDLENLASATRYYYRISTPTEEVSGDFLSPDLDSTKLVFYALGDTRSGQEVHNQIAQNILQQISTAPASQTFVISTSDLMDLADEQNLQDNEFAPSETSLRTLQSLMPAANVMGNHDYSGIFKKYFPYPYTESNDWSFDYGPAHFTVFYQYKALYVNSARWKWLVNDLSSSTKPWKFILLHEPGWSAGPHENNEIVQMLIQPLAEEYGVSAIVGGHNHYYARGVVNGVLQLTTGGGGAPLYAPEAGWPHIDKAIKAYHYLRFEISGDVLLMQVISPQGEILDEFSLTHKE